jgi:two-component system, sensor histidine kinase and response regulator
MTTSDQPGPGLELLRIVLDTMPGEIVLRDATSRIVYANRAFAAVYGGKAADLIGRRDAEMWAAHGRPAEQIAQWLAEDRRVLDTGESIEYIQEIERADGEYAYYHNCKVRCAMPDGRRLLLVQYIDITARQLTEQRRAQSEGLAAELAGIHKASVTLAHEINNQLTGIIGLSQLMRDHLDCPEEFEELLAQQLEAAQRIAAVIAQLKVLNATSTRAYLGRQELLDLSGQD